MIFYDLFCTTLRLGTEVHPSPSFLGNVGYRSTLETLILVDFGPPLRVVLPRFGLARLGSAQESSSKIGHAEPSQTVTSRLSGVEPLDFLLR